MQWHLLVVRPGRALVCESQRSATTTVLQESATICLAPCAPTPTSNGDNPDQPNSVIPLYNKTRKHDKTNSDGNRLFNDQSRAYTSNLPAKVWLLSRLVSHIPKSYSSSLVAPHDAFTSRCGTVNLVKPA